MVLTINKSKSCVTYRFILPLLLCETHTRAFLSLVEGVCTESRQHHPSSLSHSKQTMCTAYYKRTIEQLSKRTRRTNPVQTPPDKQLGMRTMSHRVQAAQSCPQGALYIMTQSKKSWINDVPTKLHHFPPPNDSLTIHREGCCAVCKLQDLFEIVARQHC